MNDRRIERALPGILADLGAGPSPDYTDLLLARTARTRQRPAWVFPERWLPMDVATRPIQATAVPWRTIGALLLIILAAIAAAVIYVGSQPRVPAPFGVARNGLIAYHANGDIFVQDTVTGISRALVTGPGSDQFPSFSPDGTRLVFLRQLKPGAVNIVVTRADGSNATVLTSTPLVEGPWWWGWTPDSRSIAIITSPRGDSKFMLLDADGIARPRIIDTGLKVDAPAFRPPDGDQILFRGDSGSKIGLYVMNLDGSGLTALVEPYQSDMSAGYEGDLRNPVWSPDGSKIVYQQYDASIDAVGDTDPVAERGERLFVMNADGSDAHPIGYTPGDGVGDEAAWSPDGTRIAFERYRDAEGWQYAVVRVADDSVIGLPTRTAEHGAELAWAPDGASILAIPWVDTDPAVVLDPNGGPGKVLSWSAGGAPDSGTGAGGGAGWQRLAP